MQDSTQRYDWEARQRWIDEQICQWSGEDDAEQFRHSETAQASTALANAALENAEREGASRPKYYLNEAANVISEIRDAVDLNITGGDKHKMMRLWSHRRFLDDLARKKFPIVGREEVERAVDK
jgi:hypothetical protein